MAYNRAGDIGVEGWKADTKAVDDSVGPYDKVADAQDDLPADPTPRTITYASDRVWDCEGEADLELDDADVYAAILEQVGSNLVDDHGEDDEPDICRGFELPQNNHLECYQQED